MPESVSVDALLRDPTITVWRAPERTAQEVGDKELEHSLDEALRNLRDLEGHDVWPDDVTDRRLRVEVTATDAGSAPA